MILQKLYEDGLVEKLFLPYGEEEAEKTLS